MKTLYQAASSIEAHMLVDLLKQQGTTAHIEGEHLQGAIGGLAAVGLIRIVVDDADYAHARTLIDGWEAQQSAQPTHEPEQIKPKWLYGLILGLVVGMGSTYAYFRVPTTENGIDYDRDSLLDEKWTYSTSRIPLKLEVDRNLDKKFDYIAQYDAQGHIESAQGDDNFDGIFETKWRFRRGNVVYSEIDTDADGYPDLRSFYNHSILLKTEYINPYSGLALRVEYFKLGLLTVAEMDTDKDGKLDTRYFYSPLGQVLTSEAVANKP